jgi:4-hydroxy-4-methyl-2-oxoglutarate aldolase
LAEQGYEQLREAIVSGRLQPNERLVEAELSRELGVGRAVVRAALARLEQEGLVERERNRGARVRLINEREAVEILEARTVLEGLTARYAAMRADAEAVRDLRAILTEMRARLESGDLLGASDQNARLHERLREAADHPTSARLISGLRSQLVRFQYRTILVPGRRERSYGEHEAIVEAIARNDPDGAEAAMRAHLSHVAEALHAATLDAGAIGLGNGTAGASAKPGLGNDTAAASAKPSVTITVTKPLQAPYAELAELGSATVYEAGGRRGYVDADLIQAVPGSRAAGPARTVRCGQDDNLMVHAAIAEAQEGEILVLTMPEARPVALVGDLLATQARERGVAALLIDASIRDVEELREMGLPIWARWVRVRGAGKDIPGTIGEPVEVGGALIRQGDVIVLDADGVAVVEQERVEEVLAASRERAERERVKRAKLQQGALSYELDGLRERVEGAR